MSPSSTSIRMETPRTSGTKPCPVLQHPICRVRVVSFRPRGLCAWRCGRRSGHFRDRSIHGGWFYKGNDKSGLSTCQSLPIDLSSAVFHARKKHVISRKFQWEDDLFRRLLLVKSLVKFAAFRLPWQPRCLRFSCSFPFGVLRELLVAPDSTKPAGGGQPVRGGEAPAGPFRPRTGLRSGCFRLRHGR